MDMIHYHSLYKSTKAVPATF